MMHFEPSEETLKVSAYLKTLPRDTFVSYTTVEEATGVDCSTQRGRNRLLREIRKSRVKSDCLVLPGVGFVTNGPETAMGIVKQRGKRTSGHLRAIEKSMTRTVTDPEIFGRMGQEDQIRFSMIRSTLGGMASLCKQTACRIGAPDAGSTQLQIALPENADRN